MVPQPDGGSADRSAKPPVEYHRGGEITPHTVGANPTGDERSHDDGEHYGCLWNVAER